MKRLRINMIQRGTEADSHMMVLGEALEDREYEITYPDKIEPQMSLAHEFGHLLSCLRLTRGQIMYKRWPRGNGILRDEIIAWRIAKSILKKEYWNEDFALACLSSYRLNTYGLTRKKNVKIIPYQTGLLRVK